MTSSTAAQPPLFPERWRLTYSVDVTAGAATELGRVHAALIVHTIETDTRQAAVDELAEVIQSGADVRAFLVVPFIEGVGGMDNVYTFPGTLRP